MTRGFAPFARVRHIPPGDNDPPITPRVAILHVAASLATTLFFFFRDRSGGVESHFFITLLGRIEQYRSIYRQADANLDANNFAVSIETAGLGMGRWNPPQRRAIKKLLLWLHNETDGEIPLRPVKRWDGAGIGYHTLFGAPSHWTPVAKSCPGPNRIKQFWNWLAPWMKTALDPPATVRVVTFNVWVGQGGRRLRQNLRRMFKDLEYPEIVALQEATGLHRGFFRYRRIAADRFPRREANSNVLLVRRRGVKVIRRLRLAVDGPDWRGPKHGRIHPPRVFIGAIVEVAGQRFDILDVHRAWTGGEHNLATWRAEHRQLVAWVRERREHRPVILPGDHQRGGGQELAAALEAEALINGIDGFVTVNADGRARKATASYGSDGHRPVIGTITKEAA